jgi:hypothetical protein
VAPPLFQVVNGLEMPGPLPQPPGCRADTQIACPGSGRREEAKATVPFFRTFQGTVVWFLEIILNIFLVWVWIEKGTVHMEPK